MPGTRTRRLLALAAATALLVTGAGCGGGAEVGEGAAVSVYVSAPMCAEARRQLARHGAEAGSVRVRVDCLPGAARRRGGLDLARIGADARTATEDSASVAFVELPGRGVAFSRPILDEAEIALIAGRSGAEAMRTVLNALDARASDESPREVVWRAR
jgi:hypothetical protein